MQPHNFMFILLTLLCVPLVATAATYQRTGTVVKVSDGDTLTLQVKSKAFKVRLSEIDSPESCQIFGPEATAFARDAVLGKTVRVTWTKTDRYRRRLGTVELADGSTLNARLVGAGLAMAYTAYKPSAAIVALELEARRAHIGLWQEVNPVPPWTFRKLHGPCPVQKR